jgi:hypothetical protein
MKPILTTVVAILLLGTVTTGATSANHAWPSAFKKVYMNSCVKSSNGQKVYCQCTLNWMQARYSYKQIQQLSASGRLVKVETKAAKACISKAQ